MDTGSMGRATQQAGKIFHVGKTYISDAKKLKELKPELFEEVKQGKKKLNEVMSRVNKEDKIAKLKEEVKEIKAEEQNVEHGVSLTNDEEEKILINLFEEGKTQEQIAKVFHVGQSAIAMRMKRNPSLVKSLSDKIKLSTVNELLLKKQGKDIAKLYNITPGDFVNLMKNEFNLSFKEGL